MNINFVYYDVGLITLFSRCVSAGEVSHRLMSTSYFLFFVCRLHWFLHNLDPPEVPNIKTVSVINNNMFLEVWLRTRA